MYFPRNPRLGPRLESLSAWARDLNARAAGIGGDTKVKAPLAQELDEPCTGNSGSKTGGVYEACTNKIYRGRLGSRAVVKQKHAETRSKCQFEASWGPVGPIERRSTEFVYRTWALTTCTEAFVLLVAALAPFRSFSTRTAGPLADYQTALCLRLV